MANVPPREPLTTYFSRRTSEINAALEQAVPEVEIAPGRLHEAMRYSLLAGGKRLRPILALAAGEALGVASDVLMPVACALEMIHTYSLIHDDLPCMDDDDLRRGRPTCHKVYGEAMAILAGDALLTHAFLVLARGVRPDRAARVIEVVAEASGAAAGMIGGQVLDIASEGNPATGELLDQIHRAKTGALIRAAVVAGGIAAGADDARVEGLRVYGERIGLAFQIVDDVLDVTASSATLGKTAGKDVAAGKVTYPSLHGVEASQTRARQLVREAVEALSPFGAAAFRLEEIAQFFVERSA